jgi:hypothetical protein
MIEIQIHSAETEAALARVLAQAERPRPLLQAAARREKDLAFVAALLAHRMIRPSVMERLFAGVVDAPLRGRLVEAWELCRRRAAKAPPDKGGDA